MSKIDNLNKWLEIAQALAPSILALVPGGDKIPPQLVSHIAQTITDVAQVPGASGADKKAIVMAALASGVATANDAGAHLDATELGAIASQGIDFTIKVVNDIHKLHFGTPVPVPVPPTTPTAAL